MALSQRTCQAPLPRKPFSFGKFSSTELSGAPDLHLSCLRWCPTSQCSADSVRVPVLAGSALHSALPTEKRKIWTETILLNPKRRKHTNCSSKETATEPSPPRKRNDTRTSFDAQWHESQWQRDRSRSDLQKKKHGKNLEPTWNNTSKFLIRAQELPSSNAHSNSSLLRLRLWTASGTSCWAPRQRYQAPGNNNVTPPQPPISLHASRHFFISGYSRNRLGIT